MSGDLESSVESYKQLRPLYEGFAFKLASLMRDILEANNIKYQVVESRAKEVSSFQEKRSRPGKSYKDPVKEITDLCGCRIIVYYQDDVDRVADAIKSEFLISEENLSRQPQLLEVDRFGYLSAHYIVSIGKIRTDLTEWRSYGDLAAEIQVRTVIQHAWSAVSHALQYKQQAAIPSKLQRRLHRIAGLFELADEEFVGLRKEREGLRLQARQDLERGEEGLPLTAANISEFLATWTGVARLSEEAARIGFEVDDNDTEEELAEYVSNIYDTAKLAGINDLRSLKAALESADIGFLELLWKKDQEAEKSSGWLVSGQFLALLMLIYNSRERITKEFLLEQEFGPGVASVILKALRQSRPKADSCAR